MNYQTYADGGEVERAMRIVRRLGPQYMSVGGVPAPRVPMSPLLPLAKGGQQYVSAGTGAGGREDNIDAKLSENEYVVDAETVALLGDGNPDKGAKKLDELRHNIRSQKGKQLAKGAISPNAYASASQYLTHGGAK